MHVLSLHNRYRAEGGEERAVADIADAAARRGHQVDGARALRAPSSAAAAAAGCCSGGVAARARWRPPCSACGAADVVHAHNSTRCSAGGRWPPRGPPGRARCCTSTTSGCSARSRSPTATERRAFAVRAATRGRACGCAVAARSSRPRSTRRTGPSAAAAVAGRRRLVAVSAASARRLTVGLGLRSRPRRRAPQLRGRRRVRPGQSRAERGEYALVTGRLVEEKGFDTAIVAGGARRGAVAGRG